MPVMIGAAMFEGSGEEGVAFVLDLSDKSGLKKRCSKRRLSWHV